MPVADNNFAVLLNPNARNVSRDVVSRISEIVAPERVYVSHHVDEAHDVAQQILGEGYSTIFTGGGDGTVNHFFNELPDAASSPRIGVLRLGTGNGIAAIVSSGDPIVDLTTYVRNPSADNHALPLCEADNTRFAFGGLGLDASILNDCLALQRRFGKAFSSRHGYFAAAFALTLPRQAGRWLRRHKVNVTVTNIGAPASRIVTTENGAEVVETYPRGAVLYDGPAKAAIFGTCPFYGYRLKALPFAGVDPSRLHLRVSNVSTARLLVGMRKAWDGTLVHPELHDFHVEAAHLKFSEPLPYQLAGESRGVRDEVTVGLAGRSVDLVRFI